MGQRIEHRIGDLLLLQLGLGLGHRQVVALPLIGGQDRQQHDGEQRQDDGQQRRPRLGERLVRRGGTGQTHDLRVDGVVP